jgi:hypothetical protein
MEKDKLLKEEEAAEFLGMTPAALRKRRCVSGPNPIPYVKIGRSVRYSYAQLKKYLEMNTYTNTQQAAG